MGCVVSVEGEPEMTEPFVLADDGTCFACGDRNPIGLKLKFSWQGDDYVTRFTVRPEHAGWAGIVHGGLLATVLDEVMARLIWEKGHQAITAKLEVRFREAVKIGESVIVAGRIARTARRGIETRAEARRSDGTVVAEASAISIPPR
jgi:acyl-coenzyme A thioesterase PaaI-like protein